MKATAHLALFALASASAPGCKLYFGDGDDGSGVPDGTILSPPDARERFDGAFADPCLAPEDRPIDCVVDVTGSVVDFVTGDPYGGGPFVDVTTAWDTVPPFPAGCVPLQSIVPDATGAFRIDDASCDSGLFPPILIVMVHGGTGDPRAPTATDARLTCGVAPACDPFDVRVAAPSEPQVNQWRVQLQQEGMLAASTRGLVILEYRDPAGMPMAGVVPFVREGTTDRDLAPAREVRFLGADRQSLVRADATMTGTSGMAVIGYDAASAFVGGHHVSQTWRWEPVGVLFADGWIFLEDRTRAP